MDKYENVYITSHTGVHKFTSGGVLLCEWDLVGYGDGAFQDTWDMAIDRYGNLYVSDDSRRDVQKFGDPSVAVKATTWGMIKLRYR